MDAHTLLLTPTQVAQFERQGFLVVEGVFSQGEVAAMRRGFERLEEMARTLDETRMLDGSQFVVERELVECVPVECMPENKRVKIHRVVWCGAAAPVLSKFGQDPRLVAMALQLLESRQADQLINQAHFKFPGDQVRFEWHQDSRHRRYGTELWTDVNGKGSFVETATAIDAMTLENGPLQFIPGSHLGGHIAPDPTSSELPEESYDPQEAVSVTMEPGSVVLFGPYVIHGSPPNLGAGPRRLFLNGFAYPGANRREYPGEGAGRQVSAPR